MAYLTPSGPSPPLVAFRVFLPDSDEFRAIFYGAFLSLCLPRNYEQFGTLTPDECAVLFNQCWALTVPPDGNIEECPE